MEFAWVPLLALMPLFLPDATAFSRSMMIGKLGFLTVWTLAYWLSKKLPKSLLPNCNSISHLRLFSRMYRQYPEDHQLLKGLQTLSRLSFCNNHGMHPCIKFINRSQNRKALPRNKDAARKGNKILFWYRQTQGKVQTRKFLITVLTNSGLSCRGRLSQTGQEPWNTLTQPPVQHPGTSCGQLFRLFDYQFRMPRL